MPTSQFPSPLSSPDCSLERHVRIRMCSKYRRGLDNIKTHTGIEAQEADGKRRCSGPVCHLETDSWIRVERLTGSARCPD